MHGDEVDDWRADYRGTLHRESARAWEYLAATNKVQEPDYPRQPELDAFQPCQTMLFNLRIYMLTGENIKLVLKQCHDICSV